jgi:pilus assembly protein Flp/PilA
MSEKVEVVQKNGKKKNEKGATLVEYALLVAVIAVGAIVAMQLLRNGVSSSFSTTVSQMSTTG